MSNNKKLKEENKKLKEKIKEMKNKKNDKKIEELLEDSHEYTSMGC